MALTLLAPAPARLLLQSVGAVALAALLVLGCDRGGTQTTEDELGPRVLELDSARVDLPDSIRQLVVRLDRSTAADMEPATAALRTGDIVRFEALDAGGHAIAFDGALLAPEARTWLEGTGQLRSPPLVNAGNAWVITFANAPPGEYPFVCVTHGARGVLTVSARP